MKRKLILMTAILAIIGGCFVGCTNDKDDDMTTKNDASTTLKETTNMSEAMSSGMSEVSSDVSKGITNVSEDINKGITNVSEALD